MEEEYRQAPGSKRCDRTRYRRCSARHLYPLQLLHKVMSVTGYYSALHLSDELDDYVGIMNDSNIRS